MIYFGYFVLFYSFGVEKTNTFIRSRGSLENRTRFQTIIVKLCTRFFWDQNGSKTGPFGAAYTYIANNMGEYTPPPPPPG